MPALVFTSASTIEPFTILETPSGPTLITPLIPEYIEPLTWSEPDTTESPFVLRYLSSSDAVTCEEPLNTPSKFNLVLTLASV